MKFVYESYFTKNKLPARTGIGVTGLAVGASIEITFLQPFDFEETRFL